MTTLVQHFENMLADAHGVPVETLREWIVRGRETTDMIDFFKTAPVQKIEVSEETFRAFTKDLYDAAIGDIAIHLDLDPDEINDALLLVDLEKRKNSCPECASGEVHDACPDVDDVLGYCIDCGVFENSCTCPEIDEVARDHEDRIVDLERQVQLLRRDLDYQNRYPLGRPI